MLSPSLSSSSSASSASSASLSSLLHVPILQVRQLSKSYLDGDGTAAAIHILQSIDLSIAAGTSVAIMGASGSGKSTLLQILAHLDVADSGEILFLNQDVRTLTREQQGLIRNQYMGFIYQAHHLMPELSVLENVLLPYWLAQTYHNTYDKLAQRPFNVHSKVPDAKAYAIELLQAVGLAQRLNHKPSMLSGGERQRTAIARALINRPMCIFADEPTGNLDKKHAHEAFDLLKALTHAKSTSLVMVTHDAQLASHCDVQYALVHGQLVQQA